MNACVANLGFINYTSPKGIGEDTSAAFRKLREFSMLQAGWSFGEGKRFSAATVASASELLAEGLLAGLEADVFPGLDGELRVSLYGTDIYLQFTINPDGRIEAMSEVGGEVHPEHFVDMHQAKGTIGEFRIGTDLWLTSESLTRFISTPEGGSFTISGSSPRRMTRLSPSSKSTAVGRHPALYVIT